MLGAGDAQELAGFYERLLGWERVRDEGEWVTLGHPDEWQRISIQEEEHYEPPAWPGRPGTQQMMIHLDIAVDELDAGVEWAVAAGASVAAHQPQEDVRVLLDPAGHPFCLFPYPLS